MRYFMGLDMGTSSVGWAVTDEHYQLLRRKGKDMWGMVLYYQCLIGKLFQMVI